jgi:hypothetical protein
MKGCLDMTLKSMLLDVNVWNNVSPKKLIENIQIVVLILCRKKERTKYIFMRNTLILCMSFKYKIIYQHICLHLFFFLSKLNLCEQIPFKNYMKNGANRI